IVFAIRLTGALNTGALSASVRALIQRHPSLRTVLLIAESRPTKQLILSSDHEIEIRHVGTQRDGLEAARRAVTDFGNIRIDLANGPLFTAEIVTFSEMDHVFVWGANHFIVDGYSMYLMSRELWLLYREFIRGRSSSLAPLSVTMPDYQIWQDHISRDWHQK